MPQPDSSVEKVIAQRLPGTCLSLYKPHTYCRAHVEANTESINWVFPAIVYGLAFCLRFASFPARESAAF